MRGWHSGVLLIILFLTSGVKAAPSCIQWGFEPHRFIHKHACLSLPQPLFRFYKPHIGFLMEHAVDPDMRRYIDTAEASKHYIDIEDYQMPLDSMPVFYDSAMAKFGHERLQESGWLPWNLIFQIHRLKNAFAQGDLEKILRATADLGHYAADACVPLHTTTNYNGHLTEQQGIHALWETQVPTRFMDTLLNLPAEARYLESPATEIWLKINEAHQLTSRVFEEEMKIRKNLPQHLQQGFHQKKSEVSLSFSEKYITEFHQSQRGMVEQQMLTSISFFRDCIYTAWILAGQPEL
jgi:hypothetical protein